MSFVLALLGVALLGWWGVRRVLRVRAARRAGRPSLPTYALVYTDRSLTLHRAEPTDTGNVAIDGAEYPLPVLHRPELLTDAPFRLLVLGIESMPLAQHRELERARRTILLGSIFNPAGDWVQMIQYIAGGLVIACALFVYLSVSTLSTNISRQQVQIQTIATVVSSPLRTIAITPTPQGGK